MNITLSYLAGGQVECQGPRASCKFCCREVHNQASGLDLAVPVVREVKGLFGKNAEFEVVAVSGLPCFKSAKHKEADVVQFSVSS